MSQRSFLALVLFACFAAQARADDAEGWTAVAISGPVSSDSRLLFWMDAHARFRNNASEMGTSILRPGLGWRVNDGLDVWAGYARVTSLGNGTSTEEDRTWQQTTYKVSNILGGKLSGRTRIEQRHREEGDDTGHRVRQFFRWARPIEGSPLTGVVWNETFVGLNDTDWGQSSGYQQNRAFVGFAVSPASNLRLEAGYLNNDLDGGTGPDRNNHNVSVALFVNL